MKKTFLASIALGISTFALASCGGEAEQVVEEVDGIPGLSVENGRMILNAVSTNPAVVYFDLTNDTDGPLMLRGVDVGGAESTTIHDYMEFDFKVQMVETSSPVVQPGETLTFEPGALHIMAMNVSPETQAGGNTEVTLTFAGGDKLSFPVEIKAAGDER